MNKKKLMELESIVSKAQSHANGNFNSDIANRRAELMQRYNLDPYGDEVEDRSQYVSTDVRDVIEAIKPELMDIFTAGDEVVTFDPRGENDVEAAQQETEVCNYVFMTQNNGYLVLYKWFHDALTQKNGYVKRYWDNRITTEIEEYENLDQMEYEQIMFQLSEDEDVTEVDILEESGGVVQATDEEGNLLFQEVEVQGVTDTGEGVIEIIQEPVMTFEPIEVRLRVRREVNKYRVVNTPPEEVIVAPEWTELHFNGCPYHAHKCPSYVSDLIADGFDEKQVRSLPAYDVLTDSPEQQARFQNVNLTETYNEVSASPDMRRVLVYENYVYHDMDGDGVAELLQVFTDENGTILKKDKKPAVQQVNGSPFNVLTPIPLPHTHYGLCPAELAEDEQRKKTWLIRQMLDNLARSNFPDTYVDVNADVEGQTTEGLLSPGAGRVIPFKGTPPVVAPIPMLLANTLQAIEHADSSLEKKTGVTSYNQGLDADSLNKTAAGQQMNLTQSQKKTLLIARTFAETGVAQMFIDMHRDLRKGPIKQLAIKLRNEWIGANPRAWRERTDMSVSVGLGTGDRHVQYQRLGVILEQQKEMLMSDPTGAVSNLKPTHIHHTLTKMTELSGFKDVANFFPEPQAEIPPQEPQKDPAEAVAEAEIAKAQMQAAQRDREMQAKAASEQAERDLKLAIEKAKIAAETERFSAKLQVDATIAREQMANQRAIAANG